MTQTFKAAYWTADDNSGDLLLTTPAEADLTDATLLAAGVREYRAAGIADGDYCTNDGETASGQIKVGEYAGEERKIDCDEAKRRNMAPNAYRQSRQIARLFR